MKLSSILTAMLFCALTLQAQNEAALFSEILKSHRMKLDYSFTAAKGKGREYCGSGSVLYQNGAYKFKTDGVEIYNDGKSMWTVNDVAKEVVIEKGTSVDLAAHPEMIIALCGQNPKNASVSLRYAGDGTPIGVNVKFKNGMEVSVMVRDAVFIEPGNLSDFSFDERSLDASYVVTDLR